MNKNIGVRIFSVFVLIAAIAGIAYFAFQAGVSRGSPITLDAPAGQAVRVPHPFYGYGMPFGHGHHMPIMGFGCFGILIPLFLFFLAVRAFRFVFWGPRWGWGHHGPWRHGWDERGVPPMFDEWHKRAHGESTEDKKE